MIILLLIVPEIFLSLYILRFKKKLDLLFQGKKAKDLEEILLEGFKKIERQEGDLKELIQKIKKLEGISQKCFQKIGVLRFNPFENVGGNQSFVIALLDSQNNGFVVSSLYTREGNRIYAKQIQNGNSQHSLSIEEKEAIKTACNS